jgi:ATP-dependent DNA helicase RecG
VVTAEMVTVGRTELAEILLAGENSGVEFKRDDIRPEQLAREMVGLANLRGGRILLGVEDDGEVSGVVRDDADEWVLTAARDKIRPPLIPFVEFVPDPHSGRRILAVTVEQGYAVHALWHNNHYSYFVRAGRQTREASPEELARLQQQRGAFRGELRPVSGTNIDALDRRRLIDYFTRVRGQDVPEHADTEGWQRLLLATEFLVEGVHGPVGTLAGVLLFGRDVGRRIPQSGVDGAAYPGREKDYATLERATFRGPLTPLLTSGGELVERGVVEHAYDFVARNTGRTARLVDGVRREDVPAYPVEAVRETLVNALIHRDYLLTYTDVALSVFADRIEVVSPGRLPNGITVEGMRIGARAARNELLKDVMRDYGYLEHMGLGVPRKIVALMRARNGTEPDFIEGSESLTVVLYRGTSPPSPPK